MNVHNSFIHDGQRWKWFKCPSVDEWINKFLYICIMAYYSSIKSNEMLAHSPAWKNLENIK